MSTIDLRCQAFGDHQPMPERFAKDNDNFSPPLEWTDVPMGTAELAITCIDPDAPSGSFVHWVVAGIDSETKSIDEGKLPPEAIEGMNGFGEIGYGGPRPPRGDKPHRLIFTLHALSERLELKEGFPYSELQRAVPELEIASGILVGIYQRR